MKLLLVILLATVCYGERTIPFPKQIIPIHYDVHLNFTMQLDGNSTKLVGNSIMEFKALEAINFVQMHFKDGSMALEDITINGRNGSVQLIGLVIEVESDLLKVILEENLVVGEVYNLTFAKYTKKISFEVCGVNLARYTEENKQKHLLLTQFEKNGAREVFPCLDEPYYKTTFTFTIVRPAEYFTLFTTKVHESRDLQNGLMEDTFKETPKMATYSLAFVISQFNYTSNGNQRFFARPEALQSKAVDFAINVAADAMKHIKEYFLGVDPGIDKVDHVAVPSKAFRPNGMENYGLIIYQESSVLRPMTESKDEMTITETITHELVHQWFGSLVTMSYWNSLWLKEGFATYLAFYFGSTIRPQYNMMSKFIQNRLIYGFGFEGKDIQNNLTILNPYDDNSEVWICYLKAPSVLHTLRNAIGDDNFREGLIHFLVQNKFTSVEPKQLYDSMQEVLVLRNETKVLHGMTINEFMTNWEFTPGLPIVTASLDYDTGCLTLSQQSSTADNTTNINWILPINLFFSERDDSFNNTMPEVFLKESFMPLKDVYPTKGWYILNKQVSTYMRVNYNIENWNRVANALDKDDFSGIHPFNRLQLLSDSFYLAKNGKIGYDIPLKISWHLRRETNTDHFEQFIDSLYEIRAFYGDSENKKLFQQYLLEIFDQSYNLYGCMPKKEDDFDLKTFKSMMAKWLLFSGHENCTNEVRQFFQEWKEAPQFQQYYKQFICAALHNVSEEDFQFLYRKFKEETDEEEKDNYFKLLGCVRNEQYLKDVISVYFSNATANLDKRTMIANMMQNGSPAVPMFLEFFKNQKNKPFNDFERGYVSLSCTTRELINKLEEISKIRKDMLMKPANNNAKFLEKHEASIRRGLQDLLNIQSNEIPIVTK